MYTVELQQALLEPEPRPRLLLTPIFDLTKREESYFLTAHDWSSDFYFELECTQQQTQYILATKGRGERYAIVMLPHSVYKPVVQLIPEIDIDMAYMSYDHVGLSIVKGDCLDVLALGGVRLRVQDLIEPGNEGSR